MVISWFVKHLVSTGESQSMDLVRTYKSSADSANDSTNSKKIEIMLVKCKKL